MRQARYWIILLPLFLVLACVGAFAQANSELTGIVTDQMGAVVGGANITLTDPATGTVHTTVSSGAGLYDFAGLNPANYNLKVTAKGFQNYVQTGIVVNVSVTFTVNVKLTVGADSTDRQRRGRCPDGADRLQRGQHPDQLGRDHLHRHREPQLCGSGCSWPGRQL